jgi:hypothetical protein
VDVQHNVAHGYKVGAGCVALQLANWITSFSWVSEDQDVGRGLDRGDPCLLIAAEPGVQLTSKHLRADLDIPLVAAHGATVPKSYQRNLEA